MDTIVIILYVVALLAFGAAMVGVPGRVNWIALGLFAYVLAHGLIPAVT